MGGRAPGAHPTSSPGLLHLGTAIYLVAKAPSQGVASILLVQPSSPLSAPYSPPEALYVQNVFQIQPLPIRPPTPTLVPGAIASGGARTMASSLAPVPIFLWQRSDPFSRAADWGASLLVHVTAAVAPHGSAPSSRSPAGLAQPTTLLHPHPAREPRVPSGPPQGLCMPRRLCPGHSSPGSLHCHSGLSRYPALCEPVPTTSSGQPLLRPFVP